MTLFSSLFRVDLLDLLKEKRKRRQVQKETKVDQDRAPRLFVVDPPDHLESHQPPRRPAIKRGRPTLERMDRPSKSRERTRHEPEETQSRPLEPEQIRAPRPPRVRTPIAEREPPRRGRRVSPFPPVEVHQANPPEQHRPRPNRPSPEVVRVIEHASLPRPTERQRITLRNPRVGWEQCRHPATPVPPQRARGSLRSQPRPRVVIHRSPQSPPRDTATEVRSPPRVEIEERRPGVIQIGRSNLSSSANRVIREAQPRQASAVRFVEPFPTHIPESQASTRRRRGLPGPPVSLRRRN